MTERNGKHLQLIANHMSSSMLRNNYFCARGPQLEGPRWINVTEPNSDSLLEDGGIKIIVYVKNNRIWKPKMNIIGPFVIL